LLKNRDALPGLSPRLGSRFCGNGDLLTFAVNTAEVTDPARGPVITSAIRYPDELDGQGEEGRGFYIEDAGVPGFVPWLVQASEAPGALRRAAMVAWRILRQRLIGDPESNLSAEAAGILGDGKLAGSFLPLLAMGRDIPDGQMKLTKRGYLDVDWRTAKSGPYFDRLRAESKRLAEAMGAEKFVDDPLWLLRRVITVHPLGGCPMGRTPEEGVVDPDGRAFGCEGLHVADGSVMPGPVGPNPSLTIAALADRFADAIIEEEGGRAAGRRAAEAVGAPGELAAAETAEAGGEPSVDGRVSVSFTEEMKGFVALGERDFDRGFRSGRESRTALMFHLTITAEDIDRFIADREHEARAEGWIECGALGGRLPVVRGIFNLFVDQEGDRSRKRMLYRLHFADAEGQPLTLAGHKVIEDDPGFDPWRDTTTLFTHILRGHVEERTDEEPEVVAAGIIHIHLRDFARQLTTFRCDPATRLDALARFGALFAGDLWAVYGSGKERGG
jgi:cholesterol oxidase